MTLHGNEGKPDRLSLGDCTLDILMTYLYEGLLMQYLFWLNVLLGKFKAAFLLRVLRKKNTWNKYSEPHLFQLKWNRNHSIPDYCLTKISIRAKRSISRFFSLFIVPSPFFLYIARTKAVLTGLKAY